MLFEKSQLLQYVGHISKLLLITDNCCCFCLCASQGHEMTSIGLLLGVSSAKLGTMDMSITRLLSIHIPALLPPTSTELDVPHNVQVRWSMHEDEAADFVRCLIHNWSPQQCHMFDLSDFFLCWMSFMLQPQSVSSPTLTKIKLIFSLQVAAVIGIGLVYQGTGHRHNAEVLLSEIGVFVCTHKNDNTMRPFHKIDQHV